jgi:hypothetical protein
MTAETLNQIATHLQFLGYEVVNEGTFTRARHANKYNFAMKPFSGGVLFTMIFQSDENAKVNRLGYLELINTLNNKATVIRFYADKDADLFMEAWYPNHYDRTEFGVFLECWDRDCHALANSEAKKYLR